MSVEKKILKARETTSFLFLVALFISLTVRLILSEE